MAGLILTPNWESEIRQLETTDLVAGGESGVDNTAPRQLGNRGEYIERRLRDIGFSAAATGTNGTLRLPLSAPHYIGPRWSKNGPFWRWTGSAIGGPDWYEGISFSVPFENGALLGFEYRFKQMYDADMPELDPGGCFINTTDLSEVTYDPFLGVSNSGYVFGRPVLWGSVGTHAGSVGTPEALGGSLVHTLMIYPAFDGSLGSSWTLDICSPVAIIQL